MKKQLFTKTIIVLVLSLFALTSCNNDENDDTSPESITGTKWHQQETVTESGITSTIDTTIFFETDSTGDRETITESQNLEIKDGLSFAYTYSSGSGTIIFNEEDNHTFTINDDTLTLDGKDYIKQ